MILEIGTFVSGTMRGQEFSGIVTQTGQVGEHTTSAHVLTEEKMRTPAGRLVDGVLIRGKEEIETLQILYA